MDNVRLGDFVATGQPLGIIEDPRFEEATMIILRSGTLFLYTDGITDAVDAHERAFGVEGVTRRGYALAIRRRSVPEHP